MGVGVHRMGYIVFGVSSSYVYEVVEILRRLAQPISAFVANIPDCEVPVGIDPVVDVSEIRAGWLDEPVVVPITTPGHRKSAVAHARALGFHQFPVVTDPTAIVASTATLSEGALVNAGAIVGARTRLGSFVSVNRGASVGHDVILEDFVSLGPSCVLCGHVRACSGAYVGAGAVVLPKIHVGRNSIVGAGAVAVSSVADRSVVMGNPARVIQRDAAGYNGVSV
jgi:sugar O-acyltransferase (sialic acid O-acetyltransferase NeuD family)